MAENVRIVKNAEKAKEFAQELKKLANIKPEEAIDHLNDALKYFNHKVIGDESIPSLKNIMKEAEKGIIFGIRGSDNTGHIFNVIKKDGELLFLDGQRIS
jgi:hypothetical protein